VSHSALFPNIIHKLIELCSSLSLHCRAGHHTMLSLLVTSKAESVRQTLDLEQGVCEQYLPISGCEIRGEELLISVLGNEC
jgi:hypothetical protein